MSRQKQILFVSYFTENYSERVQPLKDSLARWELKSDVREIEHRPVPTGDDHPHAQFLANVRYKPRFILEMMQAHPNAKAIVWTDADSTIEKDPKLFSKVHQDMAVHYRDGVELLSGTMYWRNSPKVVAALEYWITRCEHGNGVEKLLCPEQQVLQSIMHQLNLSVYYLPTEYCCIVDIRELNDVARRVDPVILHHQHSRVTRTQAVVARSGPESAGDELLRVLGGKP